MKSDTDIYKTFEWRTGWVIVLSFITMVVEILIGGWTKSMTLTADGWHMASHVLMFGLSWAAYFCVRKYAASGHIHFNGGKLLSLAGFTSAVVLFFVAVLMLGESVNRFVHPETIRFGEAIIVAVIGLVVNGLSVLVLHKGHLHDHNIHSAYLHVAGDCLTSILAIVALIIGMRYNIYAFDSFGGIIGSLVIIRWALKLIISAGKELIAFQYVDK